MLRRARSLCRIVNAHRNARGVGAVLAREVAVANARANVHHCAFDVCHDGGCRRIGGARWPVGRASGLIERHPPTIHSIGRELSAARGRNSHRDEAHESECEELSALHAGFHDAHRLNAKPARRKAPTASWPTPTVCCVSPKKVFGARVTGSFVSFEDRLRSPS